MSKSVYARLENIDAEVSKAKALLCSAQTCLEADFYEDGFGEYQGIARYHAGNLQVLLGVIGLHPDAGGGRNLRFRQGAA